ncbi:hypothetical protein IAE30_27755 [Pantoea sp. S61]|uniref:hypothetical protein n=1 Tax=Pantoea sp. S61 TaxID=2767442 RepID=UPI00190C1628|nr:hypothetical protein [Pantoea sp. S61]MBK0127540.1 hypothetical protein [Pantoea sp. S61]
MENEISVWVPVISVLAGSGLTGIIQFFINRQNHRFALEREEETAEKRHKRELADKEEKDRRECYFLAIELVFRLEEYAEKCAYVGIDQGIWEGDAFAEFIHPIPALNLLNVTADWRVLPSRLLYKVRDLSAQHDRACSGISAWFEASDPRDSTEMSRSLIYRQRRFLRQGLLAMLYAALLRKHCSMASSPLMRDRLSVGETLWAAWRQQRRSATDESIRHRKQLPAINI